MGAAGFPLGVPSGSVWAVSLSPVPRRIGLALRLDRDLLRLSRQRVDSAGLVLGHISSGRNLTHAGRFATSRSHLETVLALYDPSSHHPLVRQTGTHPQIVALAHLGIVL